MTECGVCGRKLLAQAPITLEFPNLSSCATLAGAFPQVAHVLILAAGGYLHPDIVGQVETLMEKVDPQALLSEVEGEFPHLRMAWDDAVKATQEWDVDGEFGTVCSVCAIPEPEGEQVYGAGGEYTSEVIDINHLPSGGGSGSGRTGKSP